MDSVMGQLQEGQTRWRETPRHRGTTKALRLVAVAVAVLLSISLWRIDLRVDASNSDRLFASSSKTRLTWVNGIGYNAGHMEKEAPEIAKLFGGKKVEFYHNPTSMVDENDTRGYFSDLTQAGQQKYLGRITSEVNGLVEHLRAAVRSVGHRKDGIVVHIAHSQGALVTCLAAKQLTLSEMNRIEVISFGGATPVRSTPETPFRRCINYYSLNDPLLFLNPTAEAALRSGFVSSYSNNNSNSNNNNNNNNGEDEFCFLAPRIGDPIADHMLLGPTYASALEWEGRRFENKYRSYLRRTVRHGLMTSLSVLSTVFQILLVVCQKLVSVLMELRSRLHRAVVVYLAAGFRAIRSLILATFGRTFAVIRALGHQTNRAYTPLGAKESEPSTPTAPLLASGSDSTSSGKENVPVEPIANQRYLWGIRRNSKIETVDQLNIETVKGSAALKSRWMSYKNEKLQR